MWKIITWSTAYLSPLWCAGFQREPRFERRAGRLLWLLWVRSLGDTWENRVRWEAGMWWALWMTGLDWPRWQRPRKTQRAEGSDKGKCQSECALTLSGSHLLGHKCKKSEQTCASSLFWHFLTVESLDHLITISFAVLIRTYKIYSCSRYIKMKKITQHLKNNIGLIEN